MSCPPTLWKYPRRSIIRRTRRRVGTKKQAAREAA
jgi:hypothetical protein